MSLVKSKQRVADHGEVFTLAWMVEANLLDVFADYLALDESDELYRAAAHVLRSQLKRATMTEPISLTDKLRS